MKRNAIAIAFVAAFALFASKADALSVDEKEIRRTESEVIQFENYMGPHAIIESADSITAIGTGLGNQVRKNLNQAATYGRNSKYTVIHAVDPSETSKYDADIILINQNASVDHIKNLRRIIAGYLTAAYGYSASDASTIATFVTVYNAVYRGNLDVFKERYKKVVTDNLTQQSCGLSTKWNEWPGQTQIVIPLFDLTSQLSSVDTSVLSDGNVRDKMREEDGMGIDERKNMVDIQERQAEEYSDRAQQSASEAAQERQQLAEQQKDNRQAQSDARQAEQKSQQAQQQAEQAQQKAQEAQQKSQQAQQQAKDAQQQAKDAQQQAKSNPNDKEAQQKAQEAQQKSQQAQQQAKDAQQQAKDAQQQAKDAQQQAQNAQQQAKDAQQKAQDQQKKTDEQKQRTEQAEQKAAEEQAIADKKLSEAQEQRMEIAKDQQKLLTEALSDENNKNAVVGLRLINKEKDLSGLVKFDSVTGKIIRESPVTVIRGRTALPVSVSSSAGQTQSSSQGEDTVQSKLMYIAICGENSGANSAVKLCLLDAKNMEIQAESKEYVSENSVLVEENGSYYCVIKNGNDWVVGKYDSMLNLLLKSSVAVSPDTPITVTNKGVIVTTPSNQPVLLNLKDLSSITQL